MLSEPDRWMNRPTPRTGTEPEPEKNRKKTGAKNRLSKNTLNIHIFNKYIYIHVHPCQFTWIYACSWFWNWANILHHIESNAEIMAKKDKIPPLWRHYFQNTQHLIFVDNSNDRDCVVEARDVLHMLIRLNASVQWQFQIIKHCWYIFMIELKTEVIGENSR